MRGLQQNINNKSTKNVNNFINTLIVGSVYFQFCK